MNDGTKDVAKHCANCGALVIARFCSECGQEQANLFPTVTTWFRELLSEAFTLEGKLPRTLRALAWPPGQLTRQWYAGRRTAFVSPLRLYLASALFFFFSWRIAPWSATLVDVSEGLDRSAESLTEILPAVLILFLVPLLAALVHVAARLVGPFVVPVVLALHTHAVMFFWIVLTIPFRMIFGRGWDLVGALTLLIVSVVYLGGAIVRVYGIGWMSATLRTVVVLALYALIAGMTVYGMLIYALPAG
jgi:hypothetical protein